jgi:transaldolase
MTFYLDSAIKEEAQEVSRWGWIGGATTNPNILAQSLFSPRETLQSLYKIMDGNIFYQLTQKSIDGMINEAGKVKEILKEKLILKIPASSIGFQAAAKLKGEYQFAITTIYSPSQVKLTEDVGARFAIYYHNRAKRLMDNGNALPHKLVRILSGSKTEVLAASFRSMEDIHEALLAGVKHLTIKFDLLKIISDDKLSFAAIDDFDKNGKGLDL